MGEIKKAKILKNAPSAATFMRLWVLRDHCEEGVHLDWR